MLRAIHHEGIQVLSLTEFPNSEGEVGPIKQELEPWLEERMAFLSSISSLKELIAKMQIHRQTKVIMIPVWLHCSQYLCGLRTYIMKYSINILVESPAKVEGGVKRNQSL